MEHLGTALPALKSPAHGKPADTAAGGNGKKSDAPTDEVFQQVAHQLRGFSGREINKLCMAIQTHVYAELGAYRKSALKQPTTQMIFEVVDKKVREHNRAMEFLRSGYEYQMQNTPQPSPCGKVSTPYGTAAVPYRNPSMV